MASFNKFIFVLFSFVIISVCSQEDIVYTQYGPVQGIVTDSVRKFLGIPFAAPPVNDLRWRPPQPPKPWAPNIYKATEFSAGCIQDCKLPAKTCPDKISEDCLYLNVYTPRLQRLSTPQPVMAYIHGGRYEQGAAGTVLYDGSFLTNASDVIIVTFNYRLGAFGYLTANDDITGNYGFFDQLMALQWIKNNIAAFGGDPNKVTLFGQSAGASSTAAHMISPASAGLFHQAIMQSHPAELPLRPMPDALELGAAFAKSIGCDVKDSACMRSKPAEMVLAAQKAAGDTINLFKPIEVFMPWTPVVDGKYVPMQPIEAFQTGQYTKMPMIVGAVTQEAHPFIYLASNASISDLEYIGAVGLIFGKDMFSVLAKYPPAPVIGDKRPAMGVLGSDYIFVCPNRNITLSALINNNNYSVYSYMYDHALSFNDGWGPRYWFCYGVVCHGSELPFLWNTARYAGFTITTEEITLSEQMGAYWTNFARTGDPNLGTQAVPIVWPKYDANKRQQIRFATPQNDILSNYLGDQCDFWDTIGYHKGW